MRRASTGVRPMRVRSPRIIHADDRRHHGLWLLAVILVGLALWQAYQFGRQQGGFDGRALSAERDRLVAELEAQVKRLEELRSEAVRYQRSVQIEQQASRELQRELVKLEDERARLRSEVNMLKGLISSGTGSIYIKDFKLLPGEKPNQYRYRFTLVQVKEDVETTRGKLLMKLVGREGKKKKKLDRSQFAGDGEKALKLEFSHYQDLQGEIELPEGFDPEELQIEFLPRNKELKKLETTFPWPAQKDMKE